MLLSNSRRRERRHVYHCDERRLCGRRSTEPHHLALFPPIHRCLIDDASAHHNRGVGVWGTRVFMRYGQCPSALSRWRAPEISYGRRLRRLETKTSATSAPLVINGKSWSNSGGDDVCVAYRSVHAITGKFLWRSWTIPARRTWLQSWPATIWYLAPVGGTTWMPALTIQSKPVYWGVSNASPI